MFMMPSQTNAEIALQDHTMLTVQNPITHGSTLMCQASVLPMLQTTSGIMDIQFTEVMETGFLYALMEPMRATETSGLFFMMDAYLTEMGAARGPTIQETLEPVTTICSHWLPSAGMETMAVTCVPVVNTHSAQPLRAQTAAPPVPQGSTYQLHARDPLIESALIVHLVPRDSFVQVAQVLQLVHA